MGAAPLGGRVRRHDGRRTRPHLCVCPPPLPCDGHVFASRAAGVHPLGDPLAPPGHPRRLLYYGVGGCGHLRCPERYPNALSTVCPPLPVRSCCCVRGHRPTLALVDGPYRLSRAKSRTLSLTLTVPYIYKNYDTMLTISEHLCEGLMVSL